MLIGVKEGVSSEELNESIQEYINKEFPLNEQILAIQKSLTNPDEMTAWKLRILEASKDPKSFKFERSPKWQ